MSKQIRERKAEQSDLNKICSIVFACASKLKERNLNDWSRYYTEDRLSNRINKQNGYIFSIDNVDIGAVFLSNEEPYYYSIVDMGKLLELETRVLYIETLAVKPEFQHQGYASQIIDFCKNLAKEKEIKYLRLDCNSNDEPLVEFYKKRGFVVVSPMEKEPDYLLMEMKI